MKPYYEHAGITIYHGDCKDLGQHLSASFVLTDPPYGLKYKPLRGADGSKHWKEVIVGDDGEFEPAWLIHPDRLWEVCLFGANHYSSKLPNSPGWIVWDKTPLGRKEGFIASDVEMAWTNFLTRCAKFSMQWGGGARNGEGFFHPTQKPVALAQWILNKYHWQGTVLDPYMGAGWVIVAAKSLGIPATGIEIEEKYCEIAAKRLSQKVFDFDRR